MIKMSNTSVLNHDTDLIINIVSLDCKFNKYDNKLISKKFPKMSRRFINKVSNEDLQVGDMHFMKRNDRIYSYVIISKDHTDRACIKSTNKMIKFINSFMKKENMSSISINAADLHDDDMFIILGIIEEHMDQDFNIIVSLKSNKKSKEDAFKKKVRKASLDW